MIDQVNSTSFIFCSSGNVREMYTPSWNVYPLLYSKDGVYRGIPIFLIFDLKSRLLVLVRTASLRFYRVHTINVLSKNIKNIILPNEIFKVCS